MNEIDSTPPKTLAAQKPSPLPTAGEVVVSAAWRSGALQSIRAEVRRPMAARLFLGRQPTELLALLPRVYQVCGVAQQSAARAALKAAAGGGPGSNFEEPHRLVHEILVEHLWRIWLDWPAWAGWPAERAAFAQWFRRLRAGPLSSGERHALAAQVDASLTSFARLPWEEPVLLPGALPACRVNPSDERWPAWLAACSEGQAAYPLWQGMPAETGAFAAHQAAGQVRNQLDAGRTLRARWEARCQALHEVLGWLESMPSNLLRSAAGDAPGVGLAWVPTARGVLAHRVVLAGDGRVAAYQIVAPTEWNFHPQSAWLNALVGLPAKDPAEAEHWLKGWVLALDPCVPARLNMEHLEEGAADARNGLG